MAQIDKNTVKAENQLSKKSPVTFEHQDGTGVRVLFVGNSITRHGVKEDIGWFNDWGMAASTKENDYVHRIIDYVLKKDKDAAFCICQAAEWERTYKNSGADFEKYEQAYDFGADIIIFRLIENVKREEVVPEEFKAELKKFIKMLDSENKAKCIITSSFWKHTGDVCLEEVAKETGADYIYLGDLGELPEMRADGLFEHAGVAHHPGDKGMEHIALRIEEVMDKYL